MMSSMRIKSRENPNLEISAFRGHFATRHSHNSHYLEKKGKLKSQKTLKNQVFEKKYKT